jgi:hypothetical protein
MLRRSSHLSALLCAMLAVAGCLDSNATGLDSEATGLEFHAFSFPKGLTLLLTDAPGDFKSAVVTISEIYFAGGGNNGRVSLLDDPVTVDLLELQNDISTLVAGADVAPGSYSQLRMVITGGYIEVEGANGSSTIYASSPSYAGLPAGKTATGTLQMPSFGSSGLKIDLPGGKLEVGEGSTVVLIDFDVKQSFGHQAGNSGKWVMHPVIKATDATFGGNVVARLQLASGVTLPTLNGQQLTLGSFSAKLTPAAGGTARTASFTDANGDGVFEAMFKGLVPGNYGLEYVFPAGVIVGLSATPPITVTVASNQTATHTAAVTSAALPASIRATLALGQNVTLPTVGGQPVTMGQFRAQLTPQGSSTTSVVSFTDANNDGVWEASFANLTPGSYSLTLLAPTGVTATYSPAPPVDITLTSGASETRAFTLASAVPTPAGE